MHGSAFEPLYSGQNDRAGDEHLARQEDRKWSVGSAVLLTTGINALLWGAIIFSVRQFL